MKSLITLVLTFAFITTPALAKKVDLQSEPPIKAGAEITVSGYNPQFEVFLVTINETPAIGPNYASANDLHRALEHEGSLKDFIKNKDQLLGSIFTLKKDLKMVDLEKLAKVHHKEIKAEIEKQKKK